MLIWLVLLGFLVISYFIWKRDAKRTEKWLSFGSLILFVLTILPFLIPDTLQLFASVNLLLPFVLGVSGIVLGLLGMKGYLKIGLIGLNIVALFPYFAALIIGTAGFSNP